MLLVIVVTYSCCMIKQLTIDRSHWGKPIDPNSKFSIVSKISFANQFAKRCVNVIYLWPIINRMIIPFSCSNWRSFSPNQTQKTSQENFISNNPYTKHQIMTLRHPSLPDWITPLSTTKSSIYPDHYECFLPWRAVLGWGRDDSGPIRLAHLLRTTTSSQLHLKHWNCLV